MLITTTSTDVAQAWSKACNIWNDPYHVHDILSNYVTAKQCNVGQTIEKEPVLHLENETQKIKKVIFSDPATIVLWEDGTKTVVKTQKGDQYDPEKGLAMACMRKILSKKDYHKWLEEARVKNIPINEEGRLNGVNQTEGS